MRIGREGSADWVILSATWSGVYFTMRLPFGFRIRVAFGRLFNRTFYVGRG